MDAADRALEQVCASFGGKFIGISLNDRSHALRWRDHGVTFFAVDSDQRLLLTAARASAGAFRRIFGASTE